MEVIDPTNSDVFDGIMIRTCVFIGAKGSQHDDSTTKTTVEWQSISNHHICTMNTTEIPLFLGDVMQINLSESDAKQKRFDCISKDADIECGHDLCLNDSSIRVRRSMSTPYVAH